MSSGRMRMVGRDDLGEAGEGVFDRGDVGGERLDGGNDGGDEADIVEAQGAAGRERGAVVVEMRFGNIGCTCWAMKPSCGVVPSFGSIQLKVTGFRVSMAASERRRRAIGCWS